MSAPLATSSRSAMLSNENDHRASHENHELRENPTKATFTVTVESMPE